MLDRITSNPGRMNGQPCVRNLHLTVRRIVELAALHPDRGSCAENTRNWKKRIFAKLSYLQRRR